MKKWMKAILLTLIMIFTFACSACNIDVTPPPENPGTQLPDITNPDAEMKLNISVLNDSTEFATMKRWANAYMEKNKQVDIKLTNNMSDMSTLASWHTSNTMPDIVWAAGDQHAHWSGLGYFKDMRTFLKGEDSDFFDDFYPELIETTHHSQEDESIWFMPRDYNQLVVYCNAQMFKDAGIALPTKNWTWKEFNDICAQFKTYFDGAKNYYPIETIIDWSPYNVSVMKNFGAEIVNSQGVIVANSAKMKACLDYFNSFYAVDKYSNTTAQGSFVSEFTAMYLSVRPKAPSIKAKDIPFIAVPFPADTSASNGKGYIGVGCSGYAISATSEKAKQDAAWEFLKFCTSEEGYEVVGEYGSIVPSRMSLKNKGAWTQYKSIEDPETTLDPTAFTESSAEKIDLNFTKSLKPSDQKALGVYVMQLFQSTKNETYTFDSAMNEFLIRVRSLGIPILGE